MTGSANRIRRYTLDSRLQTPPDGQELPAHWNNLRERLDNAWKEWLAIRAEVIALPAAPTEQQCRDAQLHWLELDRKLDVIQRELIAQRSTRYGVWTVVGLALTLLASICLYLVTHGMTTLDVAQFEPWPDWGPVKYIEVAAWSFFGVLCSLLYTATYFLSRRDFDDHFVTWYISTALRAPLLVVILMIVVLEFIEWYGEGGWLEKYLLEEGNKYFFIVFVSFCLGVGSESTSQMIGELVNGVTAGIRSIVRRVARKFGAVVSDADALGP